MISRIITIAVLLVAILGSACQPVPTGSGVTHTPPSLQNQFFISLNVNDWLEAYKAIDQQINGGWGYANHLDTTGYLAWRQSRVLESYLNVYQYTKDARWLEKFIQQADLVLSHRDDRLWNRTPTWSSLKYLRQGWRTPEPLLVNNAMIIYPLAKFATVVLPDESLKSYHNVALWYLKNAIETADYFQQWYIADGQRGYYNTQDADFVNYPGINAPFNWNNAMGRVLLQLFDATGEQRYLTQAASIAETFKAGLEIAPNGAYRWHYWFGPGQEIFKSAEDVSHGALDIRFAVQCFERSLVFDEVDIKRFIVTLTENIWNGYEFTSSVWGTGKVNSSIADTGIFWIPLGKYDNKVLDLIEAYLSRKNFRELPEYKWNWYMLAVSEMMLIKAGNGYK